MSTAAPRPVLLGYHRPALAPAAEWLVARFTTAGEADFNGVFLCVPGKRAGRQLLALLADRCAAGALALYPPRIGTPLELLDALAPGSGRPAATHAQRLLLWTRALRDADHATLRALAPRRDWTRPGAAALLDVASLLEHARSEVAGCGLTIGESSSRLKTSDGFTDHERWRAAAEIERAYLALLHEHALTDEHETRVESLRARSFDPALRVVLVATPDLPVILRRVLEIRPPLATLIIADPAHSDRFDQFGTVKPGAFRTSDLRDDQIRFSGPPAEQAAQAIAVLESHAGRTTAADVVIGAPDSDVVPSLRTALEARGLRARDAAGTPVDRTAPARALRAISAFLETGHTRDLAALVRHPDVADRLGRRLGSDDAPNLAWIRALDDALADRPAGVIPERWGTEGLDHDGALRPLTAALAALLPPADAGTPAPLEAQLSRITACLAGLYADVPVGEEGSPSDLSFRACAILAERAAELSDAARTCGAPPMVLVDVISLLLQMAGPDAVPSRADPGALEILGWLEVALDDASVCIITGLNEGSVPRSSARGPLLAGRACAGLGFDTPESTLERDIYLLNVVLRCHDHVTVIAGSRSSAGDPLIPSRLLLACDDRTLARRVRTWSSAGRQRAAIARPISAVPSGFVPMPRVPFQPVTAMPVTSFARYLQSPYGFFLERVLRLDEVDDPGAELDARAAGDLFHAAMKVFSESPARNAARRDDIHAALVESMNRVITERFGPSPPGVVRVQAAQLRERLAEVAAIEAARRIAGWSILHAEWAPSAPVTLDSPAGPMILTGKIDRIERHASGALAILDFKVGEKPKDPETTHRNRSGWIDLQLPLYRHLAAELWRTSSQPELTFGFVSVPAKPGAAEILMAPWNAADLDSADAEARRIIGEVLSGRFFELGDSPPDTGALGWICGHGLIYSDPLGPDADAGEEAPP